MTTPAVRVYRLDITYPVGALDERGWFKPGLQAPRLGARAVPQRPPGLRL